MSPQQHKEFEKLYENIDQNIDNKQRVIQISKLKYYFFKYLKYIQNLNQLIPKCILNSSPNSKIINYSKYYFTKITEFYIKDQLEFDIILDPKFDQEKILKFLKIILYILLNQK